MASTSVNFIWLWPEGGAMVSKKIMKIERLFSVKLELWTDTGAKECGMYRCTVHGHLADRLRAKVCELVFKIRLKS